MGAFALALARAFALALALALAPIAPTATTPSCDLLSDAEHASVGVNLSPVPPCLPRQAGDDLGRPRHVARPAQPDCPHSPTLLCSAFHFHLIRSLNPTSFTLNPSCAR